MCFFAHSVEELRKPASLDSSAPNSSSNLSRLPSYDSGASCASATSAGPPTSPTSHSGLLTAASLAALQAVISTPATHCLQQQAPTNALATAAGGIPASARPAVILLGPSNPQSAQHLHSSALQLSAMPLAATAAPCTPPVAVQLQQSQVQSMRLAGPGSGAVTSPLAGAAAPADMQVLLQDANDMQREAAVLRATAQQARADAQAAADRVVAYASEMGLTIMHAVQVASPRFEHQTGQLVGPFDQPCGVQQARMVAQDAQGSQVLLLQAPHGLAPQQTMVPLPPVQQQGVPHLLQHTQLQQGVLQVLQQGALQMPQHDALLGAAPQAAHMRPQVVQAARMGPIAPCSAALSSGPFTRVTVPTLQAGVRHIVNPATSQGGDNQSNQAGFCGMWQLQ